MAWIHDAIEAYLCNITMGDLGIDAGYSAMPL